MTDSLYFDTDCISSFLWVKEERLITSLYSRKIKIPHQVYNELSYPGTPQLKTRVDILISNGDAAIVSILTDTPEFSFYSKLTTSPDEGHIIIGKGEAGTSDLMDCGRNENEVQYKGVYSALMKIADRSNKYNAETGAHSYRSTNS